MVQAFIFGASRIVRQNGDSWLKSNPNLNGKNLLDWTLSSLELAGLSRAQIHFIGGYEIEKVIANQPDIQFVVNPQWHSTHVLGSLRYALNNWKGGDVLLMYGDTLFRSSCIREILSKTESMVLGIDTEWKNRVIGTSKQHHAEKVIIKGGEIETIGRTEVPIEEHSFQFSGLTFISESVVKEIITAFNDDERLNNSSIQQQGSLSDLVRFLSSKADIDFGWCDVTGKWAEIDLPMDLSKFIFGTKAETLERIKPFLKNSAVVPQMYFTVADWYENKNRLIKSILNRFKKKPIIVRSSSFLEDAWEASSAGAFKSVLNVGTENIQTIQEAVEQVTASYKAHFSGSEYKLQQILVQPFISNVKLSGVAFTRVIQTGSPYYIITYDELSKSTDAVTSGSTNNLTTYTINKRTDILRLPPLIQRLVAALKELEEVVSHSAIDVEFVIDNDDVLYVVQVRPIVLTNERVLDHDFQALIKQGKELVSSRLRPFPHLYGESTILSDMSDWNPAEMIGVRPQPLSISLYKYLITNRVWSKSRAKIGYHKPPYESLMYVIAGHPYIDVRNSFNNLIPSSLSPELAHKIVNFYTQQLLCNPSLHDKIEFKIAITCYTPDIDIQCLRLLKSGFNAQEVDEFKACLKAQTFSILQQKELAIQDLIKQTEALTKYRDQLLESRRIYNHSIPKIISLLLDSTIENGTIPFSILARYGFIASSMLKGLVEQSIISEHQKDNFLKSIETVAGELVRDINRVNLGKLDLASFLDIYGHLRPGTYDIRFYSYSEKPEYYFDFNTQSSFKTEEEFGDVYTHEWNEDSLKAIDAVCDSMQFPCSSKELLDFIQEAIKAREYAKFEFTKNVSTILELIIEWGKSFEIERDDLAFLNIEDILRFSEEGGAALVETYIQQKIEEGKKKYQCALAIETPSLITKPEDLDVIHHNQAQPNFITDKEITAPVLIISGEKDKESLDDKIIVIEGADPGYDWIFSHPIKGLITKYGGAGSHMTIRCTEFGLPAAIGCGSLLYNQLKNGKMISLNCRNKQIKILN